YSKAAKSELQQNLDRAFRLYVKAAEDFLHLSQSCNDAGLRASCKLQAGKALERAEKIKAVRPDVTPVAKDYFSEQEQLYVLRKSSFVNNVRIPLWDSSASASDDVRQPELSPEQQQHDAIWRKAEGTMVYSSAQRLSPQDIVQHIITDCSVCASVAVCVGHHCRFNSKIVLSNLHPRDPGDESYDSRSGVYHFRFLFNGAFRRITIDDKLPTYPEGGLMCMSTGAEHQIWPSLVEKAYMKLMGGYDFPGSNSCIDLHALVGWIPEHVDLRLSGIKLLCTYDLRIGSCVLTVGTCDAPASSMLVSELTLLPAHCYAVIDVQEHDGVRQVTMLDSWTQTANVQGREAQAASNYVCDHSYTFSLGWDTVCSHFDGVYLSWDPGIFRNQIVFHGTWKAQSPSFEEGVNRSSYFQLQLRTGMDTAAQDGCEIWIQLTRHVSDTTRTSEYISLLVNGQDDGRQSPADIDPTMLKGEYTNSIHTLVRTRVSATDTVLHLIAAYDGHFSDVGFTINVYSDTDVSWVENPPKALYMKEIDGAFTSKTSGGNYSYPTFMDNPQFHLRIHPNVEQSRKLGRNANVKVPVSVTVHGSRRTPINASLVWSRGERITELSQNDLVATSGPYCYGYARAYGDVPAGDYTLIISTFEPQQLGEFKIQVESAYPVEITSIPQEGAGMFSRVLRDAWTAGTAGGGPSSSKFANNPAYELRIDAPAYLKVRLQLADATSPTSINVSVFQRKASRGILVGTSGPYSDAIAGAVTPRIALQPGTYHIIPSTYHPDIQRAFKLIVYSTIAVNIRPMKRV
ncbi:cysteine proteinase, partial [Laetiporus sulphureus 93-53]